MALNAKDLEELLRRCAPFPWTATMNEDQSWDILDAVKNLRRKVEDIPVKNNYDRRLMALAPELAFEVLRLRKIIADGS